MAQYDVFISYRWVSPDQEWVREELFPALKAAGLRPILDVEDFVPGRDFFLEMHRAEEASRTALCVISPAYFSGNRMTGFEALNARRSDPSGQESGLVPFILRRAEIPTWMNSLVAVDWTDARTQPREWHKLLDVLHAPNMDAPPPRALDSPIDQGPKEDARPQASWRPRMIFMKVNSRVRRPYAFATVALVVVSALGLWMAGTGQQFPFLMQHAESEAALAHATSMLMKTFVCIGAGAVLLGTIAMGLLNMQIVFSAAKVFFLLAFFSFLCAVVTLVAHGSMVPHAVLALLLVAAFTKHFFLGSLGYYWKRRSLGDTLAEAVLLMAFLALIAGPLRMAFGGG